MRTIESKAPRHPLWSKEQLKKDLCNSSSPLKTILKVYAPSPDKWRGIYNDVTIWRKTDLELSKLLDEQLKKTQKKRTKKASGGRPRKDLGDLSWQDRFCEALVNPEDPADKGNRYKAALLTPYTWETISKKIQPGYTDFDEEFYEKVRAAELRIASEAESMLLSMLNEKSFEDFETAKISQAKAWYLTKVLEKMDKLRWGKEMNVKHSGQVNHNVQLLPPEKQLANLVEEQQHYFQKNIQLLSATNSDVIEVEVTEVNPEPVTVQAEQA